MNVNVYLVFLPVAIPREGGPNRKVIAAKLTRLAADAIAAITPGAYVEKIVADKSPYLSTSSMKGADTNGY